MNFKYLNFNPLDQNQVNLIKDKIQMLNLVYKSITNGYDRFDVDLEIRNIIANIIPASILDIANRRIGIHVINDKFNLNIHKDPGRKFAINYLLTSGGDNVYTLFYNDKKELIHQEKINVYKWHIIRTDINHSVTNIEKDKLRIALTINIKNYNEAKIVFDNL